MRRRRFNLLLLALTGASCTQPVFSEQALEWAEYSSGISGVAGSSGCATRIYADGRIERNCFGNGKTELVASAKMPVAQAKSLLDKVKAIKGGPLPTGGPGPTSLLLLCTNGRFQPICQSPHDDPQLSKLWTEAEKSLPSAPDQ